MHRQPDDMDDYPKPDQQGKSEGQERLGSAKESFLWLCELLGELAERRRQNGEKGLIEKMASHISNVETALNNAQSPKAVDGELARKIRNLFNGLATSTLNKAELFLNQDELGMILAALQHQQGVTVSDYQKLCEAILTNWQNHNADSGHWCNYCLGYKKADQSFLTCEAEDYPHTDECPVLIALSVLEQAQGGESE